MLLDHIGLGRSRPASLAALLEFYCELFLSTQLHSRGSGIHHRFDNWTDTNKAMLVMFSFQPGPHFRDSAVRSKHWNDHVLDKSFGPKELAILTEALDMWLLQHGFTRDNPEGDLAAAVFINLFREGSETVRDLLDAAVRHKSLRDLTPGAA